LVQSGSDSGATKDVALQKLRQVIVDRCAGDADLINFANRLHNNFVAAYRPLDFFNIRLRAYDDQFMQTYALMCDVFESDVLDEAEIYQESFPAEWKPSAPPTFVMVGRYWQVSGEQQYDSMGRLTQFRYDPLMTTEEVAATSSGTYISLDPERPKESIGAMGYAATRKGLLRQGHGLSIARMFETEIIETARLRGDTLKLLMLEAETTALPFWTTCGYRWATDSRYHQPPISFDPTTGEPNYEAKFETLLIKVVGQDSAPTVDRSLLLTAVKRMLQVWFIPPDATPTALKRIDEVLIGQYFKEFEESIAKYGDSIPLTTPTIS